MYPAGGPYFIKAVKKGGQGPEGYFQYYKSSFRLTNKKQDATQLNIIPIEDPKHFIIKYQENYVRANVRTFLPNTLELVSDDPSSFVLEGRESSFENWRRMGSSVQVDRYRYLAAANNEVVPSSSNILQTVIEVPDIQQKLGKGQFCYKRLESINPKHPCIAVSHVFWCVCI